MTTIGAIIAWCFFGLIVGAVARLLYPGSQPMSLFSTMMLGIVGSLVGGFLSWMVMGGPDAAYRGAGWIMSTFGAILVVWIAMAMSRPKVT